MTHPRPLETTFNLVSFSTLCLTVPHCITLDCFSLLILWHLQEVKKMCANQSIENLLRLGYYPGNPILVAQQLSFWGTILFIQSSTGINLFLLRWNQTHSGILNPVLNKTLWFQLLIGHDQCILWNRTGWWRLSDNRLSIPSGIQHSEITSSLSSLCPLSTCTIQLSSHQPYVGSYWVFKMLLIQIEMHYTKYTDLEDLLQKKVKYLIDKFLHWLHVNKYYFRYNVLNKIYFKN